MSNELDRACSVLYARYPIWTRRACAKIRPGNDEAGLVAASACTAGCETVPRNELAGPHMHVGTPPALPRTAASCRCRAPSTGPIVPRAAMCPCWTGSCDVLLVTATAIHWVNAACPRSRLRPRPPFLFSGRRAHRAASAVNPVAVAEKWRRQMTLSRLDNRLS